MYDINKLYKTMKHHGIMHHIRVNRNKPFTPKHKYAYSLLYISLGTDKENLVNNQELINKISDHLCYFYDLYV